MDLAQRDRWLAGTKHLKNHSGKVSISPDLPPVLRPLKDELMMERSKLPAHIKQKSRIKFLPQWPFVELKTYGQPPKRSSVNLRSVTAQEAQCEPFACSAGVHWTTALVIWRTTNKIQYKWISVLFSLSTYIVRYDTLIRYTKSAPLCFAVVMWPIRLGPAGLLHWHRDSPWWRHQMETFSALLAICAGNSPVPGEFPAKRPVTRSFDVFFDLHPNKRLSKQSWGWWFETPPCPLWRHSNASRDSPGAVGVIPWSARISPLIIQKIFVRTLFMEYHQRVCWCFGAIRRQSICRRVVCNFLECHCEGLFSIFITGNFSECVIILTMYPFKRIAAIINNVYYLQLLYDMFVFLNFHYSFPYGSLSTSGSYMF